MGGVVVKARIAVLVMILSNIFVTRLVVIFFYVRNIYKAACICATLRLLQATKKSVQIIPQQSSRTFHAVSVSSVGDGKLENMEYVSVEVGVSSDKITRMQMLQPKDIQEMEKNVQFLRTESSTETATRSMSSAEVLRSSMTPLGMNNSLNIHRNENGSGSLSSGMSSFMQNNNSVPLDRPLFVNTAMSAQQRIDIYRRLSSPPQDDEPALLFRWS